MSCESVSQFKRGKKWVHLNHQSWIFIYLFRHLEVQKKKIHKPCEGQFDVETFFFLLNFTCPSEDACISLTLGPSWGGHTSLLDPVTCRNLVKQVTCWWLYKSKDCSFTQYLSFSWFFFKQIIATLRIVLFYWGGCSLIGLIPCKKNKVITWW